MNEFTRRPIVWWGGLGLASAVALLFALGGGDPVRFYGRLHPILVHFPIALLLVAGGVEVWGRLRGTHRYQAAVLVLLGLGSAGAVAAALAGWALAAESGGGPGLERHRWLGVATAVLAMAAFSLSWIRLKKHPGRWTKAGRLYPWVLGATLVAVGGAGHLGGSLTHGPDFLFEYAPAPLRFVAGLGGRGEAGARLYQANAYEALIAPILSAHCTSCHRPEKAKGELMLHTPEALLAGGEGGPVLAPGEAEASELFHRATLPPHHEDAMPPDGRPPLPLEAVELLRWWIERGASFDARVADLEPTPAVEVVLGRRGGLPEPGRTGVFALEVAPAVPEALAAARAGGLRAERIAEGTPLLQVTVLPDTVDATVAAALRRIGPQVAWLDLGGRSVEGADPGVVQALPHLERLHLERTEAGDAWLAALAGHANLRYLNLYGTNVTDEGLGHLASLPRLRNVYLWRSAVTREGIEALRAARPGLQLHWGPPALPARAAGAE